MKRPIDELIERFSDEESYDLYLLIVVKQEIERLQKIIEYVKKWIRWEIRADVEVSKGSLRKLYNKLEEKS